MSRPATIETSETVPEAPPFEPDWRLVGHVEGDQHEIKKAQEHARRAAGQAQPSSNGQADK